jgi:hypothetical protein
MEYKRVQVKDLYKHGEFVEVVRNGIKCREFHANEGVYTKFCPEVDNEPIKWLGDNVIVRSKEEKKYVK